MPDALLVALVISLLLLAVRVLLAARGQHTTTQNHTPINSPPTASARLKFHYKRTAQSKSVGLDVDLRLALEWIAKLIRYLLGRE